MSTLREFRVHSWFRSQRSRSRVELLRVSSPEKEQIERTEPKQPYREIKSDPRCQSDPGVEDRNVVRGRSGDLFRWKSTQRLNHPYFHIGFDQHLAQKHQHPDGIGEEGKNLERDSRAMQKIVDCHHHGEIDRDHLREPRHLVFRDRAREIEQFEF